nr:unnamed protein product [Spirometra erinaceieuropaei]
MPKLKVCRPSNGGVGTPPCEHTERTAVRLSATDKSTNKQNTITITNDKGRLPKEEIERMVNDTEKFRAEDVGQREGISAKNALESYAFSMKSTVEEEEKVKEKIPEEDRKKIVEKCEKTIKWLYGNQQADKEEYEHRQKELESVCNPIITKMYQAGGICLELVPAAEVQASKRSKGRRGFGWRRSRLALMEYGMHSRVLL